MQRSALCRSRRELSNAYLLAKFGFDTASRTSLVKFAREPGNRPGRGVPRNLHEVRQERRRRLDAQGAHAPPRGVGPRAEDYIHSDSKLE